MIKKISALTILLLIITCLLFSTLVGARPLKIAILSDVHYATNATDKKNKRLASSKKILPSVLDKVNRDPKIDLVVFTGDMLVNPYAIDLKEWQDILSKHMTKPYLVVPGNHDIPTIPQKVLEKDRVYPAQDFLTAYAGHPYAPNAKNRFWSLDLEGWHLVGLDSPQPHTWGGHLSGKELRWLKRDLKGNADEPTIVFAHHGLTKFYSEYNMDPRNFIDNLKRLRRILTKNPQVKLAVSGHIHMPIVEEKNGITFLSSPTIVTYPCRYSIVTIDDDSLNLRTFPVFSGETLEKAKKGLLEEDFRLKLKLTEEETIRLYDRFKAYERRQ